MSGALDFEGFAEWVTSWASRRMRALVMAERIERHASAARWNFETAGIQKNLELFV